MADSVATKALVYYGAKLPDHPRKWWVVAKLREVLQLTPTGEREVERRGHRLFLDPGDFEHADLFWMGVKDQAELRHLERLVGPTGVFLDIGANLGYYSLELSRRLGPRATMHAFEPNPPTYDRLRRHIQVNGRQGSIIAHRMALSDRVGQARMTNLPGNSGATRLDDGEKGFDVAVSTVDAFVAEQKLERIDAMKLDVEGFEANVLRGAVQSMARFKPHLIVEFWQWGLDKAGSSAAEVVEVLDRAGYVMHDLHGAVPKSITTLPDLGDPYNVLCVHRDRLAELGTGP